MDKARLVQALTGDMMMPHDEAAMVVLNYCDELDFTLQDTDFIEIDRLDSIGIMGAVSETVEKP